DTENTEKKSSCVHWQHRVVSPDPVAAFSLWSLCLCGSQDGQNITLREGSHVCGSVCPCFCNRQASYGTYLNVQPKQRRTKVAPERNPVAGHSEPPQAGHCRKVADSCGRRALPS